MLFEGGSLASILSSFGAFDESVIVKYSRQILQAVACLHEHHIIHRDLKGKARDRLYSLTSSCTSLTLSHYPQEQTS